MRSERTGVQVRKSKVQMCSRSFALAASADWSVVATAVSAKAWSDPFALIDATARITWSTIEAPAGSVNAAAVVCAPSALGFCGNGGMEIPRDP
eukprot:15105807-Alexandrium_andersonii.AAC.1